MRYNYQNNNGTRHSRRLTLHLKGEEKVANKEWVELVKRYIIRQQGTKQERQNIINYYIDDIVWPELDALVRISIDDIGKINHLIYNFPEVNVATLSIDQLIQQVNKGYKKGTGIQHPEFLTLNAPDGKYTMYRATSNVFNLYWYYVENFPDEYADILDHINETGQAF